MNNLVFMFCNCQQDVKYTFIGPGPETDHDSLNGKGFIRIVPELVESMTPAEPLQLESVKPFVIQRFFLKDYIILTL